MLGQATLQPMSLDWLKRKEVRLPTCPAVFVKLMQVIKSPESSRTSLSEVINLDPALTGQVLKVANSAFYGRSRNVCSVEDAVLRLGYNEVWTIASALNVKKAFGGAGGWSPLSESVWAHALRVGAIARMLGARLNQQTADIFFTAGLLHDIGKMVLHLADPEYAALARDGELHGPALVALERSRYGVTHNSLGADLLDSWNLPVPVVRLVEYHHTDPLADGTRARARASFALANEFARDVRWRPECGLTAVGPGVDASLALGIVGLAQPELEVLAFKAQEQVVHLLEGAA